MSSSLVGYGNAEMSSGDAEFLSRSLVAGDRVRIVAVYDAATIACRVFDGSNVPPTSMLPLIPAPAERGGFEFGGQTAKQRIDYVTIYKLPP